jgi:hypothetical protein
MSSAQVEASALRHFSMSSAKVEITAEFVAQRSRVAYAGRVGEEVLLESRSRLVVRLTRP